MCQERRPSYFINNYFYYLTTQKGEIYFFFKKTLLGLDFFLNIGLLCISINKEPKIIIQGKELKVKLEKGNAIFLLETFKIDMIYNIINFIIFLLIKISFESN